MSDELFLENKQNKFSFLVQQSQSHKTWPKNVKRHVSAILTNTVILGALSTGQQKFTDDGRTSFAQSALQLKPYRLLAQSPGCN